MDDSRTNALQTGQAASTSPTPRDGLTAADALDELCLRLVECRLVIQALTNQIDLDMRTLESNLHMLEHRARQTREAASLICQGAELVDGRPSETLPWNITTRHYIAVKRGATQMNPEPTRLEQTNPALAEAVAAPPFYDYGLRPAEWCTSRT